MKDYLNKKNKKFGQTFYIHNYSKLVCFCQIRDFGFNKIGGQYE